ncbi:uncharacterized protein LOC114437493 isoform X2 [Parambassis ranga]|uniref:Uncharacterized protein LOC114437493 isoform X2 n=1 Tax=Parambassis ranga TaxID=210632 RepID=A0A6P7ISV2_9TELE|nr:uncharacterized protein LOC114437493 isoform X2 [Parambassis ranga]
MMLLSFSIMLLCLSASSERVVLFKEPGENVTLKCSEDCPKSIDGFESLYMYHDFNNTHEEVFFHEREQSSPVDKVTERQRYKGRTETSGSYRSLSITIKNLTKEDAGVYTCVYKKTAQDKVSCDVYTVVIGERIVLSKEPGETVTLRCSSDICPQSIDSHTLLNRYHINVLPKEVSFHGWKMFPLDEVTEQKRYKGRIQTDRADMSLTISDLTTNDSAAYTCVDKKAVQLSCTVYSVVILSRGETEERSPPLLLIFITICAVSTMVTMSFMLLIFPRVKRWCVNRRSKGGATQITNDNIYEIMNKNGYQAEAAPEQPPLSQE